MRGLNKDRKETHFLQNRQDEEDGGGARLWKKGISPERKGSIAGICFIHVCNGVEKSPSVVELIKQRVSSLPLCAEVSGEELSAPHF